MTWHLAASAPLGREILIALRPFRDMRRRLVARFDGRRFRAIQTGDELVLPPEDVEWWTEIEALPSDKATAAPVHFPVTRRDVGPLLSWSIALDAAGLPGETLLVHSEEKAARLSGALSRMLERGQGAEERIRKFHAQLVRTKESIDRMLGGEA